jgi:uncharacterized protein (DUF362 family)
VVKIFLHTVLALLASGVLLCAELPRATVYLAESPAVVRGGRVDGPAVRRMVDAVVMAAAGRGDIGAAWRTWVKPTDRVGIKVSTAGAPVASTHPAVVAAVAEGLVAAGVAPGRIVIWDRSWETINRAGYAPLARRFLVTSTDRSGGYSEQETVTAAMLGKLIIGDRDFDRRAGGNQTSSKSHLSRVLVEGVDKVVHVPALTDHLSSGLNGALSGMVLDNLDNWRRLARAPHHGDPYLPELYSDPRLGGKVVFTILDALRPQYAGGPFPNPGYIVNHGAILASRDPVALDATALDLLDNFRRDAGMPSLAKQTQWLDSAEIIGLGIAARERIRVLRAGPSSPPAQLPEP